MTAADKPILKTPCIAICGALPPPFGGVTVHLARLVEHLCQEGIPHVFYDNGGRSIPQKNVRPARRSMWWYLKFLLSVPEPIVHFNTNNALTLMAGGMVLPRRSRRFLMSLHSEAPIRWYRSVGPLRRLLWRRCARKARYIICANQTLADWLGGLGVSADRLSVMPAFIPPTEAETDPAALPPEVQDFLSSHSPVVGSHAWFGYFIDGLHVYSLDMIMELIQRVRGRHGRAGFYTLISATYQDEHEQAVLQKRKELHLEKDWLILKGIPTAPAFYCRTDVFVRPTITDGDSVSVRECLSLGVPVVASDAVARPPGCVLFKSRDMDGFDAAVESVLGDLPSWRSRMQEIRKQAAGDTAERMMAIYRRVLAEVEGQTGAATAPRREGRQG